MTAHEIITAVFIIVPIAYAIGLADGDNYPKPPLPESMVGIFAAGVISLAVAVTLRMVG